MMKLNLYFIVMDLLTLLIYPILFLHGRLRQLVKVKGSVIPVNSLPAVAPRWVNDGVDDISWQRKEG